MNDGAKRLWEKDHPPLFAGPKQLTMVRDMGIDSGRANVIRMLFSGELDPIIFEQKEYVALDRNRSKVLQVIRAVAKVLGAKQIGRLKRGNTHVDSDFFDTSHLFVWLDAQNTIIYGTVEKRFFIGNPDALVEKSKRDTRGRQLEKALYDHL